MRPLLLALSILLASTTVALAGEVTWVERRVGDLGVMLPSGGGWEVTEHETADGWDSAQVQRTWLGNPEEFRTVWVYPHQVPDIFHDWLPVEVATDYLLWEIENMQTEGIDKGVFNLLELDVYEEQHAGGLTLHVLRNVKDYIEPWHPMLELEAQELYLVFLPNFPETVTFYKIFITADCFFDGCTVDDLDLSEMTPLLDDLRDYSTPLN